MRTIVLIPLLLSIKVSAQISPGARSVGLANASTALEGVFSLGSNQAGIANVESITLALTAKEPFSPSNTGSLTAMIAIPAKIGNVGLYITQRNLGSDFREAKSGISYSYLVKSKMAIALTINYHHFSIPDYLVYRNLSFDLGFQYRLSENCLLGWHLINPTGLISGQEISSNILSKIKVGASYEFSNQVLIAVESDYDQDKYYNFRLGLEYSIINWLHFRGGTSVNPFIRYAGIGIKMFDFKIDAASSFHPQLGVSPQLSLSYVF